MAEKRSFVAAAAQLRLSQPALTRTIKRVEDVLGVRLFERTTRTVRLTDAGREFVAVAQRISNDLRLTVRGMRELADQQRGQVIVSAITSVADGILPAAVAAYRRARPGIEIHVRDGIHGGVIDDVKGGVADFGLIYLQDVPDGLVTTRLGLGRFDLVAGPGSSFAVPDRAPDDAPGGAPDRADLRAAVRIDDLAGVPLISMPPESQTRRRLDAAAAARGITLDHAVVVSQIPTLLQFVRTGVGVGLAPSASILGDLGAGLARLPVEAPDISLPIGVMRLAERGLSPAAEGLLAEIQARWPPD